MHWYTPLMLASAAATVGAPVAVQAEGPAFNCSTLQGDVGKLICSDAALAALDRKLDALYKAALAKALAGSLVRQIRQEQRGRYGGQNVSLVHQADTLTLDWLDTRTGHTDKWQRTTR
jgi:uncharacterized protein